MADNAGGLISSFTNYCVHSVRYGHWLRKTYVGTQELVQDQMQDCAPIQGRSQLSFEAC